MAKARRRPRRAPSWPMLPRNHSARLLWAGVAMLVVLSFVTYAGHHPGLSGHPALRPPEHALDALRALFGLMAYGLPFALIGLGLIGFWGAHWVRRRRMTIRLAAMLPLVSAFLEAGGRLAGLGSGGGGYLGATAYFYFEDVAGRTLGPILLWVAMIIAARALYPFRAVDQAALGVSRFACRSISALWSGLGGLARRIRARKAPQPAGLPGARMRSQQTADWSRVAPRGQWRAAGAAAPWSPPWAQEASTGMRSARPTQMVSEAGGYGLLPVPEPWASLPLPRDILPRAEEAIIRGTVHGLEDPSDLQAQIVDVAKRLTGITLAPCACPHQRELAALTFEFQRVDNGRKVITDLERVERDIALALGRDRVKILFGSTVKIRLPLGRNERALVRYSPLIDEIAASSAADSIIHVIGRNPRGKPFYLEALNSRHVLVAGTTGSGKSNVLFSIILGHALLQSPKKVKLVLADHKQEFSILEGLPHLYHPIVTDVSEFKELEFRLQGELERRKEIRARRQREDFETLIIVIDEFEGFAPTESFIRLVAESRSARMRFILAVQHPTREALGDTRLKANLLTRICFQVAHPSAAHVALGDKDAAKLAASLMGRGDCIVQSPRGVERVQAAWVTSPGEAEPSDLGTIVDFLQRLRTGELADERRDALSK